MANKRAKYYQKIWIYKQRRVGFKLQGKKKECRNATKKIRQWNEQIGRIDKRNENIRTLIFAMDLYFGVDIKSRVMDARHKLARSIFYKYGMENKIQGAYLSLSLGRAKKVASQGRLSFTRSFKSNDLNKAHFHQFKAYFEKVAH